MALSQIIIILLGTIAFAYIVGSEIGVVSAGVIGVFNYDGQSYTLTDVTSGCRLYLTSNTNQCYAFSASTDSWYPDTNKNGVVDDSTSAIPGFTSPVYTRLVPLGYSGVAEHFSFGDAYFRIWKNSAGDYVLTWGNFLTEKNPQGRWYNHQDGGDVLWGDSFNSQLNSHLASLAPPAATPPAPNPSVTYVPTCAQYGYSDSCTNGLVCAIEDGVTPPGTSLSCCIGGCVNPAANNAETPSVTDGGGVSNPLEGLYTALRGTGSISACIVLARDVLGISDPEEACRLAGFTGGGAPSADTASPIGDLWGSDVNSCILLSHYTPVECTAHWYTPPATTSTTTSTIPSTPSEAGSYTRCLLFFTQDQCDVWLSVTPPATTTPTGPRSNYDTAWDNFKSAITGGGGAGAGWLTTKVIPVATWGGRFLNIFTAASAASAVFAVFAGGRALLSNWVNWEEHPGWSTAYALLQYGATGFTAGLLLAPTLSSIFGAMTPLAAGGIGFIVGLAAFALIYAITYKESKLDAVVFNCVPWQAPTGGADCDKCGQSGEDCTAYECASLGTGCELANSGAGEGRPICTWVDEGDVAPPTMEFLASVLNDTGYAYAPLDAIYPEDTGVRIYNATNPAQPLAVYSVVPIGVKTNKIAKCSIDPIRRESIDDMMPMLLGINGDEGVWGTEHSLNVPLFMAGNLSVEQSGPISLYIKCESRNGYETVNAFVIQFDVDETPDQTAPDIIGTSILSGAPVPFGTNSLGVNIYVRERTGLQSPGGCRWSNSNKDYNSMENSMTCSQTTNTQGLYPGTYTCSATLDGLNDGVTSNFYFLCQDSLGNVETSDSINPFVLVGTQALAITSVTPANGTLIKDSTDRVKVVFTAQTSAGYDNGRATCSYKKSTATGAYTQFDNTNSYQHSTELSLSNRTYIYNIRCFDDGNNLDEEAIQFDVEVDETSPNVVRASHENNNLKIKTDEEARCVYDIVDCNYPFDNGISMTTTNGFSHTTVWISGRTYYIKCEDYYNNNPQTSCSRILSTSQF